MSFVKETGSCARDNVLDELTTQIGTELDEKKRNALIAEAFKIHSDDIGHLPLHQQALAWGMKRNVELTQLADNYNWLKWVVVKAPAVK